MSPRKPFDEDLHHLLDEHAKLVGPPPAIWTPEEARRRTALSLSLRGSIPGLPQDVHIEERVLTSAANPRLVIRIYSPKARIDEALRPTLLYLHGGGWVAGSLETHDPFCRFLASLSGVQILSVDYRLAPEHPYPAAIEDARTALDWAANQGRDEIGCDSERLAIGGDSAGANVAAAVANRLLVDRRAPKLAAQMLLYPATDHPDRLHNSWAENAVGYGLTADMMRWYWSQYAQGVSPEDAGAFPLRERMLDGLPPTLVTTAEYDVLRDEGIAYVRRLEEAGVSVTHFHSPDMHHNFSVGPGTVVRFPQSTAALSEIAAWLRLTLRTATHPASVQPAP